MKRLGLVICGFLIGYLAPHSNVKAQDRQVLQGDLENPRNTSTVEVSVIPAMSTREIIDVIAEYDIRHIDVSLTEQWYGKTIPDERRIFIVNQADLAMRRRIILHELAHVVLWNRGDNELSADEHTIEAIADGHYRKLFGAQ